MNLSLRKLVIIPLILLFISCTVTKRVHQPGYHIQWRKAHRTQPSEKTESNREDAKTAVIKKDVVTQSTPVPTNYLNVESDIITDVSPDSPIQSTNNNPINRHLTTENNFNTETHLDAKNTISTSNTHQSIRPLFWRMNPKSLRNLGIFFICLGAMFLFASLLVYWGAFSGNGGGSGAWLNFFLSLVEISSWFWLLFFILAFVLISYLFFLLVIYVFGGALIGTLVGLVLLAIGILLYTLGKRRKVDP